MAGPVLVLEEPLVELAGGVAGELGPEVDGAGALHVGEVLPAVRDQLALEVGAGVAMSIGCTTALTSSPKSTLGTPKTATSITLGWVTRRFSASCG